MAAGPGAVAARSKESGGARTQFVHKGVVVFLRCVSTSLGGAGMRWLIVGGVRLVRSSLTVPIGFFMYRLVAVRVSSLDGEVTR